MFDIIETIQRRNGARVTELADELEMSKSTIYRHLATLYEREYVNKRGDEYHIGFRFLSLGEHTLSRRPEYSLIEEEVTEIAEETGERVQFVVEDHGKGVHIFREVGDNAVETDWRVAKRVYLHQTACGKVVLSQLPPTHVEEIINKHGLPAATENTITGKEELLEELDEIRHRGYAFNREEHTDSLSAVGVPISDKSGIVIGALSVAGATYRMKGTRITEEIPSLLQQAANDIEHSSQFL
jgi:DNA-binding IclR family transcriptional regulator